MPAAVSPRVRAALVALAVGAAGCEGCPGRSPREELPAPRTSSRKGMKIPMPPEWSVQMLGERAFQVGPPGRPVLRVDRRPGEAGVRPSAETLTAELATAFGGFTRSGQQIEEGEGLSLVRVTLTPRLADGGVGVGGSYPAFFGARALEGDLVLCATLPGITPDEAREADESCRGLEFQPQP